MARVFEAGLPKGADRLGMGTGLDIVLHTFSYRSAGERTSGFWPGVGLRLQLAREIEC